MVKLAAEGKPLEMFGERHLREVRHVLRDHWVTQLICDHEAKTDRAVCSCSLWRCEPQPCVGDAINAWIDHVQDELEKRKW